MTKSELIDAVAQRTNITKSRAEQVVNCIFESMTQTLGTGQGIEIRGFGSFTVREYRGYKGRNPRTGDEVHVEPKRLPSRASDRPFVMDPRSIARPGRLRSSARRSTRRLHHATARYR
jgi:integration host factor subunit beta